MSISKLRRMIVKNSRGYHEQMSSKDMDEIKSYIDKLPLDSDLSEFYSIGISFKDAIEIMDYMKDKGFDIYSNQTWYEWGSHSYKKAKHRVEFLMRFIDNGVVFTGNDVFESINSLSVEMLDIIFTHFPDIPVLVTGTPYNTDYETNNYARYIISNYIPNPFITEFDENIIWTLEMIKYLFEKGDSPCVEDFGFLKDMERMSKEYTEFMEEVGYELYEYMLKFDCIRHNVEALEYYPKEILDKLTVQLFETGRIFLDVPGFDAWTVENIVQNMHAMSSSQLEKKHVRS